MFFPIMHHSKLCILLCLLFMLYFTIFIKFTSYKQNTFKPKRKRASPLYCNNAMENTLPSIFHSYPIENKSIFFLETSCKSAKSGKIVINVRQACAVESAAKMNPNFDVYLIYTSPGIIKIEENESDRFINALLSYKNVKFFHIDFEEFLEKTPVENLWTSGALENSSFVVEHSSDVLRSVLLWRYGGIYLDLDLVVIRSLENLPFNFAGVTRTVIVNSAVLGFDRNGSGHVILSQWLNHIKLNFNGKIYNSNGPYSLTEISKRYCKLKKVEEIIGKRCNGDYIVYPPEMFYTIPWQTWEMFFEEKYVEEVMEKIKDSYVVHLWNQATHAAKIDVKKRTAYTLLAKKYCPKVFTQCEKYF